MLGIVFLVKPLVRWRLSFVRVIHQFCIILSCNWYFAISFYNLDINKKQMFPTYFMHNLKIEQFAKRQLFAKLQKWLFPSKWQNFSLNTHSKCKMLPFQRKIITFFTQVKWSRNILQFFWTENPCFFSKLGYLLEKVDFENACCPILGF